MQATATDNINFRLATQQSNTTPTSASSHIQV
jgi:hypothetical protein